jgi:hypothetical protein
MRAMRAAFRNHLDRIRQDGGFIEDQRNYTDMHYGRVSMAYAGCEIIAVFNALSHLTGRLPRLDRLIAAFLKSGVSFNGRFGTSPLAIVRFLRRAGFNAEPAFSRASMEELSRRAGALILTYYNDGDDIGAMVHTVFISRENDLFTAHNARPEGVPGPRAGTFSEMLAGLSGGKAREILLIGIEKRHEGE